MTGYNTSADLMRSTLIEMGMDSSLIHTISIPNTVYRDRTYATGLLLSHWLDTTNSPLKRVNVYTLGCHARRSKHLFQKAVGKNINIGIIPGEDRSYDQKKWWKNPLEKTNKKMQKKNFPILKNSFLFQLLE